MNFPIRKKLFPIGLLALFCVSDTFGIDQKLRQLEAHLDAILNSDLSNICKKYENNEPTAFAEMQQLINTSNNPADVAKAKQLLAEWKKKKQNEMWLHHPGHSKGEYRVYAFNVSNDLESALKDIAAIHWQVNRLNDDYSRAQRAALVAKNRGNYTQAQQALNLAQQILDKSKENRDKNNKMFENLLKQAAYNTTISGKGMKLSGVKCEFIFFIVEM